MPLTRELLVELELTDEACERILSAHAAEVEALAQALSAAREEAAAIQAEYASHLAQAEAEARRAALAEALAQEGANPHAIPLLLDALVLPHKAWDGDTLADPAATMLPIREKYGPLFARRSPVPVMKVQPPVTATGTLTTADVMRMSAEDVNRNWSAVQSALRRN